MEMQGNEIIQDLVGVNARVFLAYNPIQDTTVEYDAFEKDIAVATFYFGRATALGGFSAIIEISTLCLYRVRALRPDDFSRSHRRLWRSLWPLPRLQSCLLHGAPLLVHHQDGQELCQVSRSQPGN